MLLLLLSFLSPQHLSDVFAKVKMKESQLCTMNMPLGSERRFKNKGQHFNSSQILNPSFTYLSYVLLAILAMLVVHFCNVLSAFEL